MLSLESTGSRMTRIAKQELYFQRPFTFDEILADIERVTVRGREGPRRSASSTGRCRWSRSARRARTSGSPRGFGSRRAPVIPRYTRPEMGALWGEDAKYARWLRVELAVCEAWARRGVVPADALDRIRERARVDAGRIDGDRGPRPPRRHRLPHRPRGLDRHGLPLRPRGDDVLRRGGHRARAGARRGRRPADRGRRIASARACARLALRHRDTLTVGRTHGIHAEPTTFGLKAAGWYTEAGRNRERLVRAREADPGRKDLRRGRDLRARAAGDRGGGLPGPRARARAGVHPGRPARPARRVRVRPAPSWAAASSGSPSRSGASSGRRSWRRRSRSPRGRRARPRCPTSGTRC